MWEEAVRWFHAAGPLHGLCIASARSLPCPPVQLGLTDPGSLSPPAPRALHSALYAWHSGLNTQHSGLCTQHSALPWGVCLQQRTESQDLGTPSIPRCPAGHMWGL